VKESGRSWVEWFREYESDCARTGEGISTKDGVTSRFLEPLYQTEKAWPAGLLAARLGLSNDGEYVARVLHNLEARGLVKSTPEGWEITE
jgi:hypothetical protein